jgi:D-sedoheptulose 7-phosphate isomerase
MGIEKTIEEHLRVISNLKALIPKIQKASTEMSNCLRNGGKVLWFGNGGSAADAQHLAAELVGRFERERRPLASIALTTDTSILTAVSNDYGFEKIFSRQVQALCKSGDVVVGISTSGCSKNVNNGFEAAREKGAFLIGLTGGNGGDMSHLCDLCLVVPSERTARIQEAHILIGHLLCDEIEKGIVGDGGEM